MRRTALSTALLTVLAVGVIGAQNCATSGPMQKTFAAGSLVIPMDNCYQKRDGTSAPGGQSQTCNGSSDDGVLRAYGLVYFLLKHNITVYWAIEGSANKPAVTSIDVTVPHPTSGAVAKKLNWGTFQYADFGFPSGQDIKYIGGPYLIDSADAAAVKSLLQSDADFAKFRSEAVVDIHEAQNAFTANRVQPLSGPPPKIAILAINPKPYHKTSLDVMYKYAVAAGLDDPNCTDGGNNCAGGLGPSCDATVIKKYLDNTLCGYTSCDKPNTCASCTQWVDPVTSPTPANATRSGIQNAKFNAPGNPGKIFDILCDGDFIPPAGGSYADTQLAKGGYKLLWVPHWDTAKVDPNGNANQAQLNLKAQLESIASFVNAGNNLFVECYGIMAMEGVTGETIVYSNGTSTLLGIPGTRFQTRDGMFYWNGPGAPPGSGWSDTTLLVPTQPDLQVGDFAYKVVSGAITTYHPTRIGSPASSYEDGVERLILANTPATSGTCNPACANGFTCQGGTCKPPYWDASSTIELVGPDGIARGTVAYLGGHDYSPAVDGSGGQTAGTRIVLNTLFNLGFACADPKDGSGNPVTCNTGKLGACSQGVLKCASGGGVQCVPTQATSAEICDGVDNDCNGFIDDDGKGGNVCNPEACTSGTQRDCYSGPAGTEGVGQCHVGKQTCTGGFWGACGASGIPAEMEVVPTPEVCNLKDDDCDGVVDDGNLCGDGLVCSAYGVCLPSHCNNENARCPDGFQCDQSGACVPSPCPSSPSPPCGAPTVCRAGACVDPCADVTCATGSSCSGGVCIAGGCALTGCSPGLVCVNGTCVDDPCASTSCPQGTFCRLGDCVRSCAYVECADKQHCDADGFCQADCDPACATGKVCVYGSCVDDPCNGKVCGAGQACQGGTCVDDPCIHVTCAVGTCSRGQCVGGGITTSQTASVPSSSKSGCGSAGTGGLVSVAALLLWACRRRARFAGAPVRSGRWLAVSAAVLVAGAVGTGCSKSGGTASCQNGQTACGSACFDLTSAAEHCGTCERACSSGFACIASGCSIDTPNPFLRSVEPGTVGAGRQITLQLGAVGLLQGARVRVTGGGKNQELDVVNPTTNPSVAIDFSGVSTGTADVRLVNEVNGNRYVSNARQVLIVDAFVLRGVSPGGVRQDGAVASLTLSGAGFAQGAAASLKSPGGAIQALQTGFQDASTLTVSNLDPGALAIGAYDLNVTNPGNAVTNALKFTVTEGQPTLSGVSPTCSVMNTLLNGSATGSYFYPSSVVHVSGGSIQDSVLATECLQGTDSLGRCVGGLRVSGDLSGVPAGTYDVVVVNPGSPAALRSNTVQVQVKASCP